MENCKTDFVQGIAIYHRGRRSRTTINETSNATEKRLNDSIELLQYHRQQNICNNYHRYGNLAECAHEFEFNK
jgi:hypothetical protein